MMVEKKEILKNFLNENEVLIVDKNPSSRNRLKKTMFDLGARRDVIHLTGSLAEARELAKSRKIGIILSDYYIEGGAGFDLFKTVREQNPENKKLCLVLVTSNISQTAVAKAAEEDVDSFIIKPYTIQSIQENLISTVSNKVSPSEYMQKIEIGKTLIQDQKYEEAIEALNQAMHLHKKPTLALFYIGLAEYHRNQMNEAKKSYIEGLSYNNIHYKCLVGLFETFMKKKKYGEAYQIVKKISKYFPANPDRLTQIVRLAIQTKNFDDMQMYYEIFTSLDERSPDLVNYIGAGMYISGKYCLLNGMPEKALQFFDNVAVSCAEFTKFIRAMVTLLVEHGMEYDAMNLLGRFPAGSDDHEDYLVSDFLVCSKTNNDPNQIIKSGLNIYNRNIRDFHCMQALVHAMKKSGYNEDKFASFQDELRKLWPDKAAVALAC